MFPRDRPTRHSGRGGPAVLAALWLAGGRLWAAQAPDWPQFLGPERNGVYRGPPLAESWPAEGPPVIWQHPAGQGFSGPVVSGDRVVLHHRVGARAVVECLEARSGRGVWQTGHPTDYHDDFGFDEGPRATPAVAHGRVYTFGAEGRLGCWNLADGAAVWSVDTQQAFGSSKGFFGRACSPLVESNLVILNVGGRDGAGIVAFDAATGGRRWQATDDEARCVELRTGKVRWSEPGLKAGSVILARGELLVLTEKGLLLRAPATPDSFKATAQVQVLPFEIRAFPALADGRLYARSKDRLWCLNLAGP